MNELPYTIVEPGFEPIDPGLKYLLFLELCTRTCYKSEDHIKEGSAQKLLKKVVNDFGHFSVTEHRSCIMDFEGENSLSLLAALMGLGEPAASESRRLFGSRATIIHNRHLRLSGNIRMWWDLEREFLSTNGSRTCGGIRAGLHKKWPFFFEDPGSNHDSTRLLDENPLTNRDSLSVSEMKRHMTSTYRLIGSRSMSHQLVRHRLAAYSQESQRYCDYGKKGFQFIIPPSVTVKGSKIVQAYVDQKIQAYQSYLNLRDSGIPPEDARENLPNACKTEVVTTFTLGIWDHFHSHRTLNKKAQWQIKGIGRGILKDQAKDMSTVFGDQAQMLNDN